MSVLTSPYRQTAATAVPTAAGANALGGHNHGTAGAAASSRTQFSDEFEFDDERMEDGYFERSAGMAANSSAGAANNSGGGNRRRSNVAAMAADDSMLMMSDDGYAGDRSNADRRGERGSRGGGGSRRGGGNSDTDEASEAEFNSPSQRDENEPMEIKEQ